MNDLSRLMPKIPTREDYAGRNFPNDFEFYKARSHRDREVCVRRLCSTDVYTVFWNCLCSCNFVDCLHDSRTIFSVTFRAFVNAHACALLH